MSDDLPPPPSSQDSQEPGISAKPRKDRAGWMLPIVGTLILVSLWFVTRSDTTREYPPRNASGSPNGSVATPESVAQSTLDAATVTIVQALDTDDDRVLKGTVRDIQAQTGCLAVTGGRVVVDPKDKAEVAEEASKRAQFVDSLEAQGLRVGHYEFTTSEGLVHQVIGFECN